MPRMQSESFTSGDQSWLGSTHAIYNARTVTVNVAAFTKATHYPEGFLPSGTPVALVGGLAVPYDKTEATVTAAGILAGFLRDDMPVDDAAYLTGSRDVAAAMVDHGRIKSDRVPHGFVTPVAAAKRAGALFNFI